MTVMFRRSIREDLGTKSFNLVRILEWVLCSICLILAIHILLRIHPLPIVLKSIFLLAAGAYFFITLTDIIVTSLLKPMFWTSWIIFALMGALAFFLCTGLLIFRLHPFEMVLYCTALMANAITGCVFLFELLYIISGLIHKKNCLVYNKDRAASTSQSVSASSSSLFGNTGKRKDKPKLWSRFQNKKNSKAIQFPSDTSLRRKKNICVKDTCAKKCMSPEVPSHGGTFHVSKDVAPILSPSPLCTIRTSLSSGSTPTYSSRSSCKPDCICTESQNSPNKHGNTIEFRTVSTSTRMIPKRNQETKYPVTVNNGIPATRDFLLDGNDSVIPSAVQNSCACACCGRVHQYTATESMTSCGDTNNMHKYQRLPTLHENSSYSSTDEPTKDLSCSPYPSPTSSDSVKFSPCSGAHVNIHKTHKLIRSSSSRTCPELNTSLISRSTLEKTDNQLLLTRRSVKRSKNSTAKVESHQQSFCNKRKDDLTVRKSRSIDQRANAIFSFEPQCKNKEIQTQPYAIERKNHFTCTSSNDYNYLSTNHQDYNDPNFSSQQNNYANSNRDSDDCSCKAQRMELRLMICNDEEDTVLPGTADRSPRNETSADIYAVRQSQQPTTVIDISEEISDGPTAYLVPTCHDYREPTSERRTKLQRKSEKCTVM